MQGRQSSGPPVLSPEESQIARIGGAGSGDTKAEGGSHQSVSANGPNTDEVPGSLLRPSAEGEDDGMGQSPFTLKTFRRSEVRNGKKVWEIVAAEGRYFPEKNQAEVEAPELSIFTDEGNQIRVLANRASLHLAGSGLVSATLDGNVRVIRDDEITVETDQAEYDKLKGQVHAAGLVRLTSPTFDVSGVGLEVEVAPQIVRLLSSVESVVKPRVVHDPSARTTVGGLETEASATDTQAENGGEPSRRLRREPRREEPGT